VVIERTKLVTKAESNAGLSSGSTINIIVFNELPFREREA